MSVLDHRQTCAYCGKGAARHTETIGFGWGSDRAFPDGFDTLVEKSTNLREHCAGLTNHQIIRVEWHAHLPGWYSVPDDDDLHRAMDKRIAEIFGPIASNDTVKCEQADNHRRNNQKFRLEFATHKKIHRVITWDGQSYRPLPYGRRGAAFCKQPCAINFASAAFDAGYRIVGEEK